MPGVMPALVGRHLIDKAIFLALEHVAENLPRLREYVGGPRQPDYDDRCRSARRWSIPRSRRCSTSAAARSSPATRSGFTAR